MIVKTESRCEQMVGTSSPPTRLAIFVPSMHEGGAERAMVKLSQAVAERGCSVDLVLAKAEGPHLVEVSGLVRIVDLKAPRTLSSLPALARYLRRERPAAMLCVMNHANIVALWARRLAGVSVRMIASERNTLSVSARQAVSLRARLMPWLTRRFYPWADAIVAVSGGVADDLAQVTGIPRDRIEVIYNPVVTPDLRRQAQVPVDHRWFGPGQTPVLLSVGRLRVQKDFPTLIRAFAEVRRTRLARLLILGEGPERPILEALVKELGLEQDVCLPGFIGNPYAYMARASAFILSSRWEGLPGVLIEALACGAPVISTDCPSGPREILADGRYGQLVPVGDVAAMAHAIETVLAGSTPRPASDSWLPFESGIVADQYLRLLMGERACAESPSGYR